MFKIKPHVQQIVPLIFRFLRLTIPLLFLYAPFVYNNYKEYKYGSYPLYEKLIFKSKPERDYQLKIKNRNPYTTNLDFYALHLPFQDFSSTSPSSVGSKSFIDPNRGLGVQLEGHPLYDIHNPLNFVFRQFELEDQVLAKSLFYLSFLYIGLIILYRNLKVSTNLSITMASLVVFFSNSLHYLHWPNYLANISLFPFTLYALLNIEKTFSPLILISVIFLSFLLPMHELLLYSCFIYSICSILFLTLSSKGRRKRCGIRTIVPLMIGVIISMPMIAESLNQISSINRAPIELINLKDLYPYFPFSIKGWVNILGFPSSLDRVGNQHSLALNLTLILLTIFSIKGFNFRDVERKRQIISYLLIFITIFLFIGFIDFPLYFTDTYRKLVNKQRTLHYFLILLLPVTFWGVRSFTPFFYKLNAKAKHILILGLMASQIIVLFFGLHLFTKSTQLTNITTYKYIYVSMLVTGLSPLVLYLKSNKLITFALAMSIIVPQLFMGYFNLPFYKEISFNTFQKTKLGTKPRALQLSQYTDKAAKPTGLRPFSGVLLFKHGLSSITYYETGHTQSQNQYLEWMWRDEHLNYFKRQIGFERTFKDYWIIPSPKSFIQNSNIDERAMKWLKMMGVSYIVSDLEIENLSKSDFKGTHYLYDLAQKDSILTLIQGCSRQELQSFLKKPLLAESFHRCSANSVQNEKLASPFNIDHSGILLIPFILNSSAEIKVNGVLHTVSNKTLPMIYVSKGDRVFIDF